MGGSSSIADMTYSKLYGEETRKPGESLVLRNKNMSVDEELILQPDAQMDNMHKIFTDTWAKNKHCPFLGTRQNLGGGKYGKYIFKTYNEIKIEAELLGRGLLELGLCGLEMHEGEEFRFLGLYSKNREEWLTADIASWHISATTVPLYDTLGSESKNFIIEQTQLRTIILSSENIEKILEERREGKCQSIKNLVAMDVVSEEEKKETEAHGISLFSMKEVMKSGETSHQSLIPCTTNSYANLCYTSGTTGDVKGALLTQRNITSACLGAHALPPYNQFNNKDAHCSYLPLAHVFEKIIVHVAILCGAKIGFYHGDIFKLSEDFQELKPSIILSVPRLFNRFYSVLVSKMGETKGFKRKLVDRALRIKTEEYRRSGGVTHKLYDALVFNKMRKAMGGKFWLMISGAAPIEGKVLEMLKICFCVPILEGYGQTENAAGGACSSIGDTIAGHIGAPFKCTEFKLVDIPEMDYYVTDNGIWKGEQVPMPRGEILMRGPANGRYFKNPQKTAETFIDGWLHTGDVGTFLPGGRIKIIDRKSNFFKLQQGEYIAPEKLENIYTMSPYVVQIFIYGDGFRSYLVAIVVLDPEYMKKVAEKMKLEFDMNILCKNWKIKGDIIEDFNRLALEQKLTGLEKIKKVHLIEKGFSVEEGTMTPTLKIRRKQAREVFSNQIETLYAEE